MSDELDSDPALLHDGKAESRQDIWRVLANQGVTRSHNTTNRQCMGARHGKD